MKTTLLGVPFAAIMTSFLAVGCGAAPDEAPPEQTKTATTKQALAKSGGAPGSFNRMSASGNGWGVRGDEWGGHGSCDVTIGCSSAYDAAMIASNFNAIYWIDSDSGIMYFQWGDGG